MLRQVLSPIHPDGWRFIAIFAVVAALLLWLVPPLGWLGVIATLWCVYFFRDPWRVTPTRARAGRRPGRWPRGRRSAPAPPPAELGLGEAPMLRIGIFLNVFDVHVNRMPMSGRVAKLAYHAGKFFNASLDKASEENERMAIRLATAEGADIAVVQIAGLVARRIVCDAARGPAGDRRRALRPHPLRQPHRRLSAGGLDAAGRRRPEHDRRRDRDRRRRHDRSRPRQGP